MLKRMAFVAGLFIIGALAACTRGWETDQNGVWQPPGADFAPVGATTPTPTLFATPVRKPGEIPPTPTPNSPRPLPTLRAQTEQYVVQWGDTLAILARRFNVSMQAIMGANGITNPNLLEVGQTLVIPAPNPAVTAPGFKIIPNSEFVASPSNAAFDVAAFVAHTGGYLSRYHEEIGGQQFSGAEIVRMVSLNYSVNPRLLLALLEYRSQWLSQAQIDEAAQVYPLGWHDPQRQGLWSQLNWAANELNRGYYLWKVNAVGAFVLADGNVVRANATVNAGTAAVQHFFALLDDLETWQRDVSPEGVVTVYQKWFGYPFDYALEPLVPPNLVQPPMQLPFEKGVTWYFTGGPHGAWGDGSAWAALDFAPNDISPNAPCAPSTQWAVAVADGLVVRSGNGVVMLDLDGDGYEQTGWDVLYLHIADAGRVPAGTYLHAGERIGHPSCEGGVANAAHLHLARKYNGEWVSADGSTPWVLDGWVSSGAGRAYDGFLKRGSETREACECNEAKNALMR